MISAGNTLKVSCGDTNDIQTRRVARISVNNALLGRLRIFRKSRLRRKQKPLLDEFKRDLASKELLLKLLRGIAWRELDRRFQKLFISGFKASSVARWIGIHTNSHKINIGHVITVWRQVFQNRKCSANPSNKTTVRFSSAMLTSILNGAAHPAARRSFKPRLATPAHSMAFLQQCKYSSWRSLPKEFQKIFTKKMLRILKKSYPKFKRSFDAYYGMFTGRGSRAIRTAMQSKLMYETLFKQSQVSGASDYTCPGASVASKPRKSAMGGLGAAVGSVRPAPRRVEPHRPAPQPRPVAKRPTPRPAPRRVEPRRPVPQPRLVSKKPSAMGGLGAALATPRPAAKPLVKKFPSIILNQKQMNAGKRALWLASKRLFTAYFKGSRRNDAKVAAHYRTYLTRKGGWNGVPRWVKDVVRNYLNRQRHLGKARPNRVHRRSTAKQRAYTGRMIQMIIKKKSMLSGLGSILSAPRLAARRKAARKAPRPEARRSAMDGLGATLSASNTPAMARPAPRPAVHPALSMTGLQGALARTTRSRK